MSSHQLSGILRATYSIETRRGEGRDRLDWCFGTALSTERIPNVIAPHCAVRTSELDHRNDSEDSSTYNHARRKCRVERFVRKDRRRCASYRSKNEKTIFRSGKTHHGRVPVLPPRCVQSRFRQPGT